MIREGWTKMADGEQIWTTSSVAWAPPTPDHNERRQDMFDRWAAIFAGVDPKTIEDSWERKPPINTEAEARRSYPCTAKRKLTWRERLGVLWYGRSHVDVQCTMQKGHLGKHVDRTLINSWDD